MERTARFFSEVSSDRIGVNEYKVKQRRFSLNMRKHIFTVRVTKHWLRLPKDTVDSPSLKIFKSYLDMVLGNCFSVTLLEQGAWIR